VGPVAAVGDHTKAALVAESELFAESFSTEKAKYQVPAAKLMLSNLKDVLFPNAAPLERIEVPHVFQSVAEGVANDV
jgi:hypothetical protein